MILVFRRTGQRRYGIEARREGFPDVVKSPAPGFDPLMPHDMQHLIVEAQLGLKHGIFGQLATGGTAGTFEVVVKNDNASRKLVRVRSHVRTRGKKMLNEGRDDCAQSERATYICLQEWLARSRSTEQRKLAKTMAEQAKQVRGVGSTNELRALDQRMDDICKHMDELSSRWSSLRIGDSIAVRWPDLAIVS